MIRSYRLAATPGFDPAPNVPTPEEIGQAESLRHELEVLYLSRPAFKSAGGIGRMDGVKAQTADA